MFLLLVWSAFGANQLEVTSDNRSFFSSEQGRFAELLRFEETFTSYTTSVFVVTGEKSISDSTAHQTAHRWLAKQVDILPSIARVDSLLSFPTFFEQDGVINTSSILPPNCAIGGGCTVTLTPATESLVQNRLLSKDRLSSAVIAYFQLEVANSNEISEISKLIESRIRKTFEERFPSLTLNISGGLPMMQAFADAAENDLATLVPIGGVTLFVVCSFVLGSFLFAALTVLIAGSASLIALGLGGWTGLTLNSATSSIPIVIAALLTATMMHLFLHVVRGRDSHGATDASSALRSALLFHATPIAMTVGTTIVGMLSLLTVPSPPVRELGIWVSVGLAVGLLLTFTALPAALTYVRDLPESWFAGRAQTALNGYARSLEQNMRPSWRVLLVFGVCLIGLARIEVNDDFVEYFDSSTKFRTQTDYITERLAGPYGIELIVANGHQSIFNPTYFEYLESLTQHLRTLEGVRNVISANDLLEVASRTIDPDTESISLTSEDYLSQLFLTYELSLQKDQSTLDFVTFDQSASRVSMTLDKLTSKDIRLLGAQIEDWHRNNAPSGLTLTVTGESIPTSYLSIDNIGAMFVGMTVSILFSAGLIAAYYRDAKVFVVAAVSILIPVVLGFGIWGWLYSSIGLATTVVIAITIGVVVDDSIHLIVRAKDGANRLGHDGKESAAYAVYRVGLAVIATTIVLTSGFALLLFSGFELNSAFGLCTIIVLFCAMAFDLLVLPSLLGWVNTPG